MTAPLKAIRIPLIGSPTNRASDLSKDQRFVNCFPEVVPNPAVEGQRIYLVKRNGFARSFQPTGATGEGRAIHVWNNHIITVIGDKVYRTDDAGVSTLIVTLTTSTGYVGLSDYKAANDYLIIVDGIKGYYVNTSFVSTEITDPEFPTPHIPTAVFMDGYLFVQKTTGEIFNCDAGDVTSWAATSYIQPESYPDGAMWLARQNNLIVSLNENSIEFFYDAANPTPGSPLARNLQAIMQFGCASGTTVAQEEGLVVFVAQSATGEKFVVAIEGTKDNNISTEAINRIISNEGVSIQDSWGYLTRQKGHLLYVLNLPSQARTLVYDIETKYWHEWEWNDGANDTMVPMIDNDEFEDEPVFLHQTNGYIYIGSPAVYEDDEPISVLIQTSRFDMSSAKVKYMSRMEILGDWQATTSPMSVYWSDNDYKSWTTARTVDLMDRAYIYRCGSFRRRAWRLLSTANTPLRLDSIEVDLSEGTH